MKRENFEEAKRVLQEIESRETTIKEIDAFNQYADNASCELRCGRLQVYIPVRYDKVIRKFAHGMKAEIQAELDSLNAQLSKL